MRWWISCRPYDWRARRLLASAFWETWMTITDNGFSATRRLILQGAGAVALIGLGNLPLSLTPAFAAANDKYPEEAFKQKNEADAIKLL
jgi:sulfur-oxidizing protein SoxY